MLQPRRDEHDPKAALTLPIGRPTNLHTGSPALSCLVFLLVFHSVPPCLSCLLCSSCLSRLLSLHHAPSCSLTPSRLSYLHSCVMFLRLQFYWEGLVFPCSVCLVLLPLWHHVNLCQLCSPCVLSFCVFMSVSPSFPASLPSLLCILSLVRFFLVSGNKAVFEFTFCFLESALWVLHSCLPHTFYDTRLHMFICIRTSR